MSIFKKKESSPHINLAATFDQRSSNETLDLGDEVSRLVCFNLENADLFKTHAIQTRNGTQDLSNGIIGANSNNVVEFIYTSGTTLSGTSIPADIFAVLTTLQPSGDTYAGMLIIPSGDLTISSGKFISLSDIPGPSNVIPITQLNDPQYYYDINFRVSLFSLNQVSYPASGAGFMSGTSSHNLSNIAYSGNFAVGVNRNIQLVSNNTIINGDLVPVAMSELKPTNFGQYSQNSAIASYSTAEQEIDWSFDAPYIMTSGNVYFMRIEPHLTSGTAQRTVMYRYITSPNENGINTIFAQEFPQSGNKVLMNGAQNKTQLYSTTYTYSGNVTNIVDNPVGTISAGVMISGGTYTNSPVYPLQFTKNTVPFSGATNTPPQNTDTVSFGQVMSIPNGIPQNSILFFWFKIPNGIHSIFGGYIYANTFSGISIFQFPNPNATISHFKRNQDTFDPSNYSVNYVMTLSAIVNASGAMASGTYTILSASPVAVASGNYVFTNPMPDYYNPIIGPSGPLEKIYGIFNAPVSIAGQAGANNFLLTVDFYDIVTGLRLSDYTTFSNNGEQYIASPLITALNDGNRYSGTYVVSQNDNGQYVQFNTSTSPIADGHIYDLVCGLVETLDNNAITLIYDYQNSINSATKKIVYGYQDKLSTFDNPEKENWTTIWSGAAIGDNNIWSATTTSNLFFACQNAASSGVVWTSDPSYSGMAYDHGHRPNVTIQRAIHSSGNASLLPSGTYGVMLAVAMDSGGFRASKLLPSGIVIPSGDYIEIDNLDTLRSQYPFDVNHTGDLTTYVFVTEPDQSLYYLANLQDKASMSQLFGVVNPFPITGPIQFNGSSSGTTFIGSTPLSTSATYMGGNPLGGRYSGVTVPAALDPTRPESYLTFQIDTPKFKKILPFFNQMIGVGKVDEAATIFYGPPEEPQIWGEDGLFAGRIPLIADEEITGIERYRQVLIVYTTNKTYRLENNTSGGIPFNTVPIDPAVGCVGMFTTVATGRGVYSLSVEGPTFCDGQSIEFIGQEILPWYLSLDHQQLIDSYALHDITKSTITWSIGNDDTNTSNNFALVYNYLNKSWIVRKGQAWNVGAIVRDNQEFNQTWIGDVLGSVKRDDVGNTDSESLFTDGDGNTATIPIQLNVETPWISLKNSSDKKLFRFLSVDAEQSSTEVLQIDVFFDYATVPQYSRLLSLDSTNPNKRINLGGDGRIVKFIIKNINNGAPQKVSLYKLRIDYQTRGEYKPAGFN